MNMKKLIEQADFDNVQQISKRWKKQNNSKTPLIDQSSSNLIDVLNQSQTHKENFPDPNIPKPNTHLTQKDPHSYQSHDLSQKKRQIIPQIIDQDTEHFRNRLQHLLNTFKTDAVSEFMSMKKSMLDYQKETVKSDTQKYLTMYQQKHQQLLQTKQKLIQMTRQAQKKTIQCQLMSNHIAKLNERVKITKYLSRPFALLYQNKQKQKMIKFKFREAAKSDNKKTLCKAFSGWRNIFREAKDVKNKQLTQKTISSEVNQIVGKFQKQMEMLKQQLNQALNKNQQFQNNKHIMQQNLKKAFLRGVCAMNMEAMGVLDGDSNSQANNTNMNISNLDNLPNMTMNHSMMNMTQKPNHANSSTNLQNSSVLIGKIKSQSKDHKWKQAPIMGLQQETDYEEPRPILVKPSTEGKVIKIIDGKSSTMANSSVSTLNSGMDKKKSGVNTNTNNTLNQTAKSMISSRKKI